MPLIRGPGVPRAISPVGDPLPMFWRYLVGCLLIPRGEPFAEGIQAHQLLFADQAHAVDVTRLRFPGTSGAPACVLSSFVCHEFAFQASVLMKSVSLRARRTAGGRTSVPRWREEVLSLSPVAVLLHRNTSITTPSPEHHDGIKTASRTLTAHRRQGPCCRLAGRSSN